MDIVTAGGIASISAAIAALQLPTASLWHESACGNPDPRLAGPWKWQGGSGLRKIREF